VKVYILILNWNGWKDTLACLESIGKIKYKNIKIVICDNASNDGSVDNIYKWCIDKNVGVQIINENEDVINESYLTIIKNRSNYGFAGGNNVGVKYISRFSYDYIWFLNNDTVVEPEALKFLLLKSISDKKIGICGSKLIYYDTLKVQALGGAYDYRLGRCRHIVEEKDMHEIDYIVGASMLVKRQFIEDVGMMNEEYFLYFEELDWALRAKEKYDIAVAEKSIVFHKEGSSIGAKKNIRNFKADYYTIRNRLKITRKFFPLWILIVKICAFRRAFTYIRKYEFRNFYTLAKIIIKG